MSKKNVRNNYILYIIWFEINKEEKEVFSIGSSLFDCVESDKREIMFVLKRLKYPY